MPTLEKAKLFRYLRLLQQENLKEFMTFLNSPYFNTKQELTDLVKILLRFHPHYNQPRFKAKAIFKKAYPDEPFSERKLQKHFGAIIPLISQFLKAQQLKQDDLTGHALLTQAIAKSTDPNLSQKLSKEYQEKLEASSTLHTQIYYKKFFLFRDLYQQSLQRSSLSGKKEYLTASNRELDAFYAINKLEFICGWLSRNKLLLSSPDSELPFTQETINWITKHFKGKNPVIEIHLKLIKLYQQVTNDVLYQEIRNLFFSHVQLFDQQQRLSIIYQLINYDYSRIKKNQPNFSDEQLDLFKFGMEKDIFLENGYLPEQTYLNIAISFAIAKKIEQGLEFVKNYTPKLSPHCQNNAMNLATTYLLFHQGKFYEAHNTIQDLRDSSIPYLIRSRLIEVRCLYELQLIDKSYSRMLKPKIHNYEQFFKRAKEINTNTTLDYLNFSEALRSIIHWDPKQSFSKTNQELTKKIMEYESIVARDWLLEKVRGLKNKPLTR